MPNLDFDGHDTLYATHGLHPYAAKCPPQLVKYGLRYYSKPGEDVLDPMVGSGTTLVEGRLMGRNAIGYDIDPLARLIAQVKSRELDDESIGQAYEEVIERVTSDLKVLDSRNPSSTVCERATLPDFHNRDYWFSPGVSKPLALLSYHISETSMPEDVRDFLWVAFSSLILAKKSVANARDIIHSRHHYWEHPCPPDVLGKLDARVRRMRRQMNDFRDLCRGTPAATPEARLGDARCLPLEDETVDLVFTSPPYATALDYPRAHFLAVACMQRAFGISLCEYKAGAPEYIGSERGQLSHKFVLDERLGEFDLAQAVLLQLSERSGRHAKLIHRYFVDMYQVLSETARVLRNGQHAIVVVCPSHIRKIEIPTHEVFIEMAPAVGLRLKKKHTRTINKRQRVLPYMPKAFGKRMSTEFVLIFQKP
jgi:DNA modification methylase